MFGLFKKKLKYDAWNCSVFNELKELSIDNEQIINEYNALNNSDITTIKRMGFNTINSDYEFTDLTRMKYVLNEGGILIKKIDILTIAYKENMVLENVDGYSGSLSISNIKDIINMRSFLNKVSCDFKYFEKKTFNAPPNADWKEISASSCNSWPSLYEYKKEAKLEILHNKKGTSNKIIFVPITANVLAPIILIQSDRKNKIEDALK